MNAKAIEVQRRTQPYNQVKQHDTNLIGASKWRTFGDLNNRLITKEVKTIYEIGRTREIIIRDLS